MMTPAKRTDVPTYVELIFPTLKAVADLGGSAQGREITSQVLDDIGATDEQVAITYDNRPKSVLIDRLEWARSYAKLGGALDSPQRGLYVLSTFGKEVLSLPEPAEAVREMDRQVRANRARIRTGSDQVAPPIEDEIEAEDTGWTDVLLDRLHRLSPEGFEEFVMYVLRTYDLELTRVGGTGDQGIDGIGIAPLSPVLSSRVAVQAKRYDPTSSIGREVVALFQRDAAAAGAERAVLVTLGRFSKAARLAAVATTPTVDLIDGQKLCELVREKEIGIRIVPQVQDSWFDRFDPQT
jgi:restriction system protein